MFLRIAINEFKLFLRDRKAVLLTFMMPMALVFLFALMYGGMGKNSDTGTIGVGFCDLDKSADSKKLFQNLDTTSTFKLTVYKDSLTLKDAVFNGELSTGMVILPGSAKPETGAQYVLYVDKTKKIEASIVQPLLTGKLMETNGEKLFKPLIMERIRDKFPDMDSTTSAEVDETMSDFSGNGFMSNDKIQNSLFEIRAFESKSGTNPGLIQAFAGTAVMTLLFAMAGMGAAVIEEKERGTLRKILMSPVRPFDFLFGRLTGAIIISSLQLLFLAVFTMVVFGLPLMKHLPETIILVLCTAFACSSFGMFLASIASSRKQIESMSTLIVMLMSLVGGSMIPIFFMPAWMQNFSVISINYWSNMGFFDIYLYESGMSALLLRCGVLVAYGAVLLSIALYSSQKKLFRV